MAKSEKAKTKKNPFSAIAKFFRETKAEFKKVVKKKKKQLINNSIVVIASIIASGIFVGVVDIILNQIVKNTLLR